MYSLSLCAVLVLPALQAPVSAQVTPEPAKIVRTEYDLRELVENRERTRGRPETQGRKLFISRCAVCHDPLGHSATPRPTLGPWLDAELFTVRGEAAVRTYIIDGSAVMPGFQYQFDAGQIDQILAYLKTISPEARPNGVPGLTTGAAPSPRPD